MDFLECLLPLTEENHTNIMLPNCNFVEIPKSWFLNRSFIINES